MAERQALVDQEAGAKRADAELAVLRQQLHEIELVQTKLEDEVAMIETKVGTENRKLNSGTVTAPREIQALSEEIDALGRRKRVLEDEDIELMEKAEPLTADIDRLERERAAFDGEAARLRTAIAAEEAAIDAEVASVRAERAAAAADIPADLLVRYEKLRAKLGGIAVARLEGDRCLGCHVSLPAMEVDAARHSQPEDVVIHEDCGRILVR